MGLLQRVFRRRRWTMVAWVCLAVVGFQVLLFHADRRRNRDHAGKIAEEVDRLHLAVENAAKRKRLQALPESDIKTSPHKYRNSLPLSRSDTTLDESLSEDHKKSSHRKSKPSFKIYVYDLPERFHGNLTDCVQQADQCYNLEDSGMGSELRQSDHINYRNTHQHSLEVILHQKLLQSEYRTLNHEEADVFYIPFYPAIACACKTYEGINLKELHTDLWNHLAIMPYFSKAGRPLRPHFMSLGSIEREHWSSNCPLLRDVDRTNGITFIGIQKEPNNDIRKYFHRENKPIIIAPYPSFGHFDSSYTKSLSEGNKRPAYPDDVSQTTRDIRIFMAASSKKAHDIRVILKRQMNGTSQRYSAFSSTASKPHKTAVWYNTPKCSKNIQLPIIDWMRHSIFCLQPPGESPTRKSFYDAIMAGCIPVTFKPRKGIVKYPFQEEIDYGRFTVNIPLDDVLAGSVRVIDKLKDIPNYRIKELQKRLIQADEAIVALSAGSILFDVQLDFAEAGIRHSKV
ncbi:uncharacterized protein [Amphiura filiformis]|uniref:uncharacterized protein n=1 Tax=Amphiura filiformis TaxID=82378 RepID=UPI003B216318